MNYLFLLTHYTQNCLWSQLWNNFFVLSKNIFKIEIQVFCCRFYWPWIWRSSFKQYNNIFLKFEIKAISIVVFLSHKINIKFDLCINASLRTISIIYLWISPFFLSLIFDFHLDFLLELKSLSLFTHTQNLLVSLFIESHQNCWAFISFNRRKL